MNNLLAQLKIKFAGAADHEFAVKADETTTRLLMAGLFELAYQSGGKLQKGWLDARNAASKILMKDASAKQIEELKKASYAQIIAAA